MTVRLFLTGKFLPNYVEAVFASRRLPPKAAVSACSRHSFVEGIRNGGLDVTQNRRSTLKIHYGRTKLPALQRFFSFPVLSGQDRLALFGLVLLLCGCLFQPVKKLSSLMMCSIRQASASAVLGSTPAAISCSVKEAMALVDFFGNFPAYIGQMEKVIVRPS